jgi:hypothetical protein
MGWLIGGLCLVLLGTLLEASSADAGVLLRLDWDYVQGTDPAVKFRVYRQSGCAGPFGALADVSPVGTAPATYTYRDPTAVSGQTYCWQVTALSASGKESTASNVVSFSVPSVVAAPTNMRLTVE